MEAKGREEALGLEPLCRLRQGGIPFFTLWDAFIKIVKIVRVTTGLWDIVEGPSSFWLSRLILGHFLWFAETREHLPLLAVRLTLLVLSTTSKWEGKFGGIESPVSSHLSFGFA